MLAVNDIIHEKKIKGLIETVPGLRTNMLHFDPIELDTRNLIAEVKERYLRDNPVVRVFPEHIGTDRTLDVVSQRLTGRAGFGSILGSFLEVDLDTVDFFLRPPGVNIFGKRSEVEYDLIGVRLDMFDDRIFDLPEFVGVPRDIDILQLV